MSFGPRSLSCLGVADAVISSLQNPRVKQLVRLRDRRPRDEAGVFLVEGYREIRRALEKGIRLTELYHCPGWYLGENEPALLAQAAAGGTPCIELSREAFAKVAYRERPDGLLAVAPQWHLGLDDLPAPAPGRAPFLLVVEGIEKPGNLGTILRSADAAGRWWSRNPGRCGPGCARGASAPWPPRRRRRGCIRTPTCAVRSRW